MFQLRHYHCTISAAWLHRYQKYTRGGRGGGGRGARGRDTCRVLPTLVGSGNARPVLCYPDQYLPSPTSTSATWLAASHLVSCPAGNNLRKIRLVTLRAFLGLLHTSAGFERGHIWTFSPLHGFNYHQLASAQARGRQWAARIIGHTTIWLARSNNSVVSRKAPESSPTLPDRFSVGFSGWSRDYFAPPLSTMCII